MNKAILMGRLTRDPQIKTTGSGIMYTNFSLAVNRRFAKENQQSADFINIIAWGKTAEFCTTYFKKGSQIGVVGRIQSRSYTDKDGKTVYATDVVAEEVYFADSKRDSSQQPAKEDNAQSVNYDDFSQFGGMNEFDIGGTEDDLVFPED